MLMKMTGKDMKEYAENFNLRIKEGVVTAFLSSAEKRTSAPIKTISAIPDGAKGWYDDSIMRFDASTPRTTLKVTFRGTPTINRKKAETIKKAEKVASYQTDDDDDDYATYSGCAGSFSSC